MSDDVQDFFSPSFSFPYFCEFNSFFSLFLFKNRDRFSSCDSGKGEERSMVKESSSMITSGLNDPQERQCILLSVFIENTALVGVVCPYYHRIGECCLAKGKEVLLSDEEG